MAKQTIDSNTVLTPRGAIRLSSPSKKVSTTAPVNTMTEGQRGHYTSDGTDPTFTSGSKEAELMPLNENSSVGSGEAEGPVPSVSGAESLTEPENPVDTYRALSTNKSSASQLTSE